MKTRILHSLITLALIAGVHRVSAQGTAFTYQGRLTDAGNPAQGIYDLRFAICDSASGGNTIAGPLTNASVIISNGLFTVALDFGPGVFNGDARWLQIGVRTGANDFTVLAPRQSITATPYALQAATATSVPTTNLTGTIPDARLSTNVALLNGSASFAGAVTASSFTGNGGGLTNLGGTLVWQPVAGTARQAVPNVGYLANSSSLITITLPTSPNLGDVVRVAGSGTGGWKIAQNAGQAVLSGSAVALNVGVTWTAHGPSNNWHCVACSADGTKLVAGT